MTDTLEEVRVEQDTWFDDTEYKYLKRNLAAMRSRERNIHSFEIGYDPRDDNWNRDQPGPRQPIRWQTIVAGVMLAIVYIRIRARRGIPQ